MLPGATPRRHLLSDAGGGSLASTQPTVDRKNLSLHRNSYYAESVQCKCGKLEMKRMILVNYVRLSVVLSIISAVWTQQASGLGFEAFGPAEGHMGVSSDWPKGVMPLRKHASRVYWQEVNGNDRSYFDGGIAEINEVLQKFSEIEMQRHIVVVRAGRPSATSFGGKATPYAVEFHLPGGIYLFHARRNAKTGLFLTSPRLFMNLSQDLISQVGKLEIPKNIELHAYAYDADLLLASAESTNQSNRSRAIQLLGEDGVDSEQALAAIEAGLTSDNQYVVNAAKAAKQQLDSSDPAIRKLRASVRDFLLAHPQRHRAATPEEVFKAIKAADAKYAKEGFTARGTLVGSSGTLMNWIVTMGQDKLVVRQTAVDEAATGVIEHTIFASPEYMGTIQRSQYWVDGELIQSNPFMSREPVGNTYDLLIGRLLWPIGIGFSRRIDRVERVNEHANGMLLVVAFGEDNLGIRWELTVDPSADYLVTQAKGYRTGRVVQSLEYIVDAVGIVKQHGRFANHTGRWSEGVDAMPTSVSVHSVSSQPDIDLVFELQDKFAEDSSND